MSNRFQRTKSNVLRAVLTASLLGILFLTGQSAVSAVAPPTVAAITPSSGTALTGVAITGAGFSGASLVTFGGVTVSSFTVVSDNLITTTAPLHAPGAVHVLVRTAFGTNAPAFADIFTYLGTGGIGAPVVTSVIPPIGTVGTVVTITGTGFTGAGGVTFGAVFAFFTVVNDTQIVAAAPANIPLAVHVLVTNAFGTSAATTADVFTYLGAGGPIVTGISPTFGTIATVVTITGTGFVGATSVTFGGVASFYTIMSNTQIIASAPGNFAGAVHIIVTTALGTSPPTVSDLFTYVGSGGPVVNGISPTSGGPGTSVTITGFGFTGATSVTFGGLTAFATVISDTQIIASAPSNSPGTVHVVVTTPLGTSASTVADLFTYLGAAAPVVTGISPTSGGPGTVVIIIGTGFTGATSVTFGGIVAAATVNSDTQITATAPSNAAATVHVLVTTGFGTSGAVTADLFTYVSSTMTYTLSFRWSLIAWLGQDGISVDAALRSGPGGNIVGQVTAVFRWFGASQVWQAYFPGAAGVPGANDFTVLNKGVSYWIAIIGPGSTTWVIILG